MERLLRMRNVDKGGDVPCTGRKEWSIFLIL